MASLPPPPPCDKHADIPTTVRHADGSVRCAWCEVAELRLQQLTTNNRNTELELECAQLQLKNEQLEERLREAARSEGTRLVTVES